MSFIVPLHLTLSHSMRMVSFMGGNTIISTLESLKNIQHSCGTIPQDLLDPQGFLDPQDILELNSMLSYSQTSFMERRASFVLFFSKEGKKNKCLYSPVIIHRLLGTTADEECLPSAQGSQFSWLDFSMTFLKNQGQSM